MLAGGGTSRASAGLVDLFNQKGLGDVVSSSGCPREGTSRSRRSRSRPCSGAPRSRRSPRRRASILPREPSHRGDPAAARRPRTPDGRLPAGGPRHALGVPQETAEFPPRRRSAAIRCEVYHGTLMVDSSGRSIAAAPATLRGRIARSGSCSPERSAFRPTSRARSSWRARLPCRRSDPRTPRSALPGPAPSGGQCRGVTSRAEADALRTSARRRT